MEIIVSAKDRQAAEANKYASILLEEIDLEKEREELKKAAAARKRDKKKQKKKKKLQAEKEEADTNAKNKAGKENGENEDKNSESKGTFFWAYSGIAIVGISQTIVCSQATLIPEWL